MDEAPSPSPRKSILLADNEQFIVVAYKDGLERAGYSVTVANDGVEALAALQSTSPDLLILELMMPKMNGFELLQAMKDDLNLKDVPVLVLTNLSQDSDEAEARGYGIVDFMVKADVSLKDLLERVNEIFSAA